MPGIGKHLCEMRCTGDVQVDCDDVPVTILGELLYPDVIVSLLALQSLDRERFHREYNCYAYRRFTADTA